MKSKIAITVLVATAAALAGCGRQPVGGGVLKLPQSAGPYEGLAPAAGVRTLAENAGTLVIPKPSSPTPTLAIEISADFPWGVVADAIRASVTGGERSASVYVVDSQGTRRTIRLPLDARLTGPLFAERTTEIVPGENIIRVVQTPSGAQLQYLGQKILPQDAGGLLRAAFTSHGDFYFPAGEPPTPGEFPVIIDADPNVRFEDVLQALSQVQSAGFSNSIVDLRGQ